MLIAETEKANKLSPHFDTPSGACYLKKRVKSDKYRKTDIARDKKSNLFVVSQNAVWLKSKHVYFIDK